VSQEERGVGECRARERERERERAVGGAEEEEILE
jgi:hypothetical protein